MQTERPAQRNRVGDGGMVRGEDGWREDGWREDGWQGRRLTGEGG